MRLHLPDLIGLLYFVLHVCLMPVGGAVQELYPAIEEASEAFERQANALQPGDTLILHGGVYSQTARRAITAQGTEAQPITIKAAEGEQVVITRPAETMDQHNNIEFVDCAYLTIQGLHFQGGSIGVRFIRGQHVTFRDCEISETGNNALTMNSGHCHAFVVRDNHIHHTGLSEAGPTEGEGMYIGSHDGSFITTDSLFEGNYIHHLRSTSKGGNDGIEIKFGSYGNIVRGNTIHDTTIGRQYPGIFVYGGGAKRNIVEDNVIWNAGTGIQVIADALVRNNTVFNCLISGITSAPHKAVPQMRNVTLINNRIVNHPQGLYLRWAGKEEMECRENVISCPGQTALNVVGAANLERLNRVEGGIR